MLEPIEGRGSRKLAAAEGEPQAVTRHRVDEAGRIAGQQQARTAGRPPIDGERAESDRRESKCGGARAWAELRIVPQRVPNSRRAGSRRRPRTAS